MPLKNRTHAILAAALLIPAISGAANLNIINETEYTLSFSHNNVCSRDIGAVKPQSTHVIPEAIFEELCKDKTTYCSVRAYKNNNCEEPLAASFTVSTTAGVTGVYPNPRGDISLYGDGFNIYFQKV
ncbi:MAG: hypothetical protein WAW86_10215 [Gammaproteobacteria bacterium]